MQLLRKEALFSGVADQIDCKPGTDRSFHVLRAFLNVKLTENKVEPRDGGK